MTVFDFVHHGAREMLLARPAEARDALVFRRELGLVSAFAQLAIGAAEVVVVADEAGLVRGIAGPGRHAFDASVFPFLAPLGRADGQGAAYLVALWFVSTAPRRVRFELPPWSPGLGDEGRWFGEATVSIIDPGSFVGSLEAPADAERLLTDTLAEVIRSSLSSPNGPGPAASPDDTVRWLQARTVRDHGACARVGLIVHGLERLPPEAEAPPSAPISQPTVSSRTEIPALSTPAKGAEVPCRRCKKSVVAAGRFCPDCGSPLGSLRWCVDCGQPLNATARFCAWCGARATVA